MNLTIPTDDEDREQLGDDFPGLAGNALALTFDLDTHRVRDWPAGREAKAQLMPRDSGTYELVRDVTICTACGAGDHRDGCGAPRPVTVLATRTDYVPDCLPEEYGDYLHLRIGPEGEVRDRRDRPWKPDADGVAKAFGFAVPETKGRR